MNAQQSPAGDLRHRLAEGDATFFMALRTWPTAEAVHLAHNTGHHAVYVDLQHGALSVSTTATLCLTAVALGMPSLVRIPALDTALIGVVLNSGAAGIIVPDIETPEQARKAVAAARHPPHGNRSIGGARGHAMESTPFVAVMIESAEGVFASDRIAAVNGIDAILIGTHDLTASLSASHSPMSVSEATQRVIDSGKAHGVPVIIAGLRDSAIAARMVERGAARCFIVGTDISYALQGARSQIAAFAGTFGTGAGSGALAAPPEADRSEALRCR